MKQSSSTLKKLSFELGGNAPFIVFDDADLDKAVDGAIASKFRSLGQTCVCANRIYVQAGIHDKFVEKLTEKVNSFRIGNGFDSGVTHSCLINERSVDKVISHVEDAVSKGAKYAVKGGKLTDLGPNFYSPTVLTGVTQDMKVASEETFGPLAAIIKFDHKEEAVSFCNDTSFGLAAYVFSESMKTCWYMSESVEAGMVAVNVGVFTDAALPFGGVKESGFGREGSLYGIDDYTVVKTVIIGDVYN